MADRADARRDGPGSDQLSRGAPVASDPEAVEPDLRCLDPTSGYTRARLLTRFEYDNTVRDLVGDETRPARDFPEESRGFAFDNDARLHSVSPALVESLRDAAERLARQVVEERLDTVLPCELEELGVRDCGLLFVDAFLLRAFRREVPDEVAAPYRKLFEAGLELEGLEAGVGMVIEAALQSPWFLYRFEAASPGDEPRAVDPYELASRMSYFLWSSMPDEALMEAARAGRLGPRGIEAQARRMFADPRARDSVVHFFMQWLDLEDLESLAKDASVYPDDQRSMRIEWKESVERFVLHAVYDAGSVRSLLLSRNLFVEGDLGLLYAEPGERAGLLTHPAVLAKLAHPDQSSPIRRGVYVRERILCQTLPSPPNDVDITPPAPDPNATTRERFAAHTEDAACRGCHVLIDPIGFGFEAYDALGRYRAVENGAPIDASGELYGTQEPAIEGPFTGAVDLARRLSESRQVRRCLVTQLFRFAMGRGETEADRCTLLQLENALVSSDRLSDLFIGMTRTDAFRMKREEDSR